jgi:hypothetical protein
MPVVNDELFHTRPGGITWICYYAGLIDAPPVGSQVEECATGHPSTGDGSLPLRRGAGEKGRIGAPYCPSHGLKCANCGVVSSLREQSRDHNCLTFPPARFGPGFGGHRVPGSWKTGKSGDRGRSVRTGLGPQAAVSGRCRPPNVAKMSWLRAGIAVRSFFSFLAVLRLCSNAVPTLFFLLHPFVSPPSAVTLRLRLHLATHTANPAFFEKASSNSASGAHHRGPSDSFVPAPQPPFTGQEQACSGQVRISGTDRHR